MMKSIWLRVLSVLFLLVLPSMACDSGGLIPFLPTPTLIPTLPPTATPIPTSTPTLVPTQTPPPTATSTPRPTGMAQTALADGVLVTDYDAGFTFQFSREWMVVPITLEDLQGMSENLYASNPDLARSMQGVSGIQGTLRLMAMSQNLNTIQDTMVTNLNVVMQQDAASLAFPLDTYISLSVQQLQSALSGVTVLSSGIHQNANGVEYGVIEIELQANTTLSTSVLAYEKLVYIKTPTAMITITLAAPASKRNVVTPIFDAIIASIQLLP